MFAGPIKGSVEMGIDFEGQLPQVREEMTLKQYSANIAPIWNITIESQYCFYS